eukprot:c11341_g1_i2.p1 GENE.c11341_g1_i2~~c11341_g1_i2.p1  ORF type:complete len:174 (-),score=31.51 c11341_g1_i2:56-577(-)
MPAPQENPALRFMFDIEHFGDRATTSAAFKADGSLSASYLRTFTPRLSGGLEGMYHPQFQMARFVSRYETKNYLSFGEVNTRGDLDLKYMRKCGARVRFYAGLTVSPLADFSIAELGYAFELKQANVYGRVDTSGTIGCLVEEKIQPHLKFIMCAQAHQLKEQFSFGFGLKLG